MRAVTDINCHRIVRRRGGLADLAAHSGHGTAADSGLLGQFRFFRRLAPWLILFATALDNGGAFCWLSYVNPLMTCISGFVPSDMMLLIMLAGLSMLACNLAGGRLSDRFGPYKVAFSSQGVMCLALLSIFFLAALRIPDPAFADNRLFPQNRLTPHAGRELA